MLGSCIRREGRVALLVARAGILHSNYLECCGSHTSKMGSGSGSHAGVSHASSRVLCQSCLIKAGSGSGSHGGQWRSCLIKAIA